MSTDPERYLLTTDPSRGTSVALLCVTCGDAEDWDGLIRVFDSPHPSLGDVQTVAREHDRVKHSAG